MQPITIEVIYKGHQCPSCFYMVKAVEEILPRYGRWILFKTVNYMTDPKDACRLYQLSVALYGVEAVRKRGRVAPIPSLFINGELVFNKIPPRDVLADTIDLYLLNQEMQLAKETYH